MCKFKAIKEITKHKETIKENLLCRVRKVICERKSWPIYQNVLWKYNR